MKKTKKIRLVLISAAFASCNRQLTQFRPTANQNADSVLTSTPSYDSSNYSCQCQPYIEPYPQLWAYSSNPFAYYYFNGAIGQHYYQPNKRNQKNIKMVGNQVIVRSGWGKTSLAMSGLS